MCYAPLRDRRRRAQSPLADVEPRDQPVPVLDGLGHRVIGTVAFDAARPRQRTPDIPQAAGAAGHAAGAGGALVNIERQAVGGAMPYCRPRS